MLLVDKVSKTFDSIGSLEESLCFSMIDSQSSGASGVVVQRYPFKT